MASEAAGGALPASAPLPPAGDPAGLHITAPQDPPASDVTRANEEAVLHGRAGGGKGHPGFWGLAVGSAGIVYGAVLFLCALVFY